MRGVRAGPGRQGAGPGRATQLDQAGNGRAPEAPPLRDTCWAKPSERSGGGWGDSQASAQLLQLYNSVSPWTQGNPSAWKSASFVQIWVPGVCEQVPPPSPGIPARTDELDGT